MQYLTSQCPCDLRYHGSPEPGKGSFRGGHPVEHLSSFLEKAFLRCPGLRPVNVIYRLHVIAPRTEEAISQDEVSL